MVRVFKQQQYSVVPVCILQLGIWILVDGQAGPCMGLCMGGCMGWWWCGYVLGGGHELSTKVFISLTTLGGLGGGSLDPVIGMILV